MKYTRVCACINKIRNIKYFTIIIIYTHGSDFKATRRKLIFASNIYELFTKIINLFCANYFAKEVDHIKLSRAYVSSHE